MVPNGPVSIVVLLCPGHLTPQRSQRAAWGRITVILHEIFGLGATTDLSGSQGARSNDKWAILRRRCETCPISASCDDTLY
uniref:Uncharacterized protein n=1 Tax=Magnetococcus massalia (strain MO-1) TaxID=451514 RepID=A0A1S7LLH0_MAGMO|nr:protein of unknown function [Candidatus Magnetococcus massalia]